MKAAGFRTIDPYQRTVGAPPVINRISTGNNPVTSLKRSVTVKRKHIIWIIEAAGATRDGTSTHDIGIGTIG